MAYSWPFLSKPSSSFNKEINWPIYGHEKRFVTISSYGETTGTRFNENDCGFWNEVDQMCTHGKCTISFFLLTLFAQNRDYIFFSARQPYQIANGAIHGRIYPIYIIIVTMINVVILSKLSPSLA